MTSRTRIPRAELTGICGAVVKRMSRRMLGDVAEPVEVTWHNRTTPDVADDVELAENVSIAMLTVLETLGPVERAVFVLHEVFEMPYAEIAEAGVAGQRVGSAAVTERGDVRFRRTASGKRFRDLRR